jgi:protein required for attachment to host cells
VTALRCCAPSCAPARPAEAFRQAKEAFVEEMADRAAEVCRQRNFQAVFIAAPARLVGPLRRRLATQATVAGALQKDLTKAPDAALGRWLSHPVTV